MHRFNRSNRKVSTLGINLKTLQGVDERNLCTQFPKAVNCTNRESFLFKKCYVLLKIFKILKQIEKNWEILVKGSSVGNFIEL